MDLSKIVAYNIPLPSLPHQVEASLPVLSESKHDAETLRVLSNNKNTVCFYLLGHFAFKHNSLKKITPPEVWLQGMLKLRKKHHKHRYEVKQRNASIKNKSIDY